MLHVVEIAFVRIALRFIQRFVVYVVQFTVNVVAVYFIFYMLNKQNIWLFIEDYYCNYINQAQRIQHSHFHFIVKSSSLANSTTTQPQAFKI